MYVSFMNERYRNPNSEWISNYAREDGNVVLSSEQLIQHSGCPCMVAEGALGKALQCIAMEIPCTSERRSIFRTVSSTVTSI